MSNIQEIIDSSERDKRRRRINRIKMIIIITIIIFLILPTIFCCMLFAKINNLEKQIDVLKFMHDDEYNEAKKQLNTESDNIVYAADEEFIDSSLTTNKKDIDNSDDQNMESEQNIEKADNNVSKNKDSDNKKMTGKVYLTFDDGPSENTEEILDILKEYNVKATFFVIGKEDEHSKKMYKRIVEEGHTLGMHSYSHKYNSIYKSLTAFKKDFTKISDLLYNVTGERSIYYRFPGGSSNVVSRVSMDTFIKYLNKEKITYFDWNVMNGDATSKTLSEKELIKNVMTGVRTHDTSVVLMHDLSNKKNTVTTLGQIISKLQKEGYEILPIDESVTPIQHIKADTIK